MLFAPQVVAFWEREADWPMPSVWAFVWALLWAEAGPVLSDWPWAAPPSSRSSTLYFPHLCTYHPVHPCLVPPLDRHLIFLFPQPLAQASGQCVLKNVW